HATPHPGSGFSLCLPGIDRYRRRRHAIAALEQPSGAIRAELLTTVQCEFIDHCIDSLRAVAAGVRASDRARRSAANDGWTPGAGARCLSREPYFVARAAA